MLLNYFDKYNINTDDLQDKLNIIGECDAENSRYISKQFLKTVNYLFGEEGENFKYLNKGIFQSVPDVDVVAYFSNSSSDEILKAYPNAKVIVVGNKKSSTDEILSIKNYRKVLKTIGTNKNVIVGFNLSDIDFFKYYYTRMKIYFLNLADKLQKIDKDKLEENVQGICDEFVLNKENFKAPIEKPKGKINLRHIIRLYRRILKENEIVKTDDKLAFFIGDIKGQFDVSMLNELSIIFDIYSEKDDAIVISRVYDVTCERLLDEAMKLNYCDFVDNKCMAMRYGFKYGTTYPETDENGCCSNTYLDKGKNCRYLNEDHSCAICSISCRLFACGYLQQKGIDHSLWQYPLVDVGFGKLKKINIVNDFFTPKEVMMKKLKIKK